MPTKKQKPAPKKKKAPVEPEVGGDEINGRNREEIAAVLAAKFSEQAPPICPPWQAMCSFPDPRHKSKKRRFLIAFAASGGNVCRAVIAAQINRRSHYHWLEQDKKYKAAFLQAEIDAAAVLEDEARRRAFEGTLKGVYYMGELVDFELEYSDVLLVQLLKARHPAHKQTSSVTLKGTGTDGSIGVKLVRDAELAKLSEDELLERARLLRIALERATAGPESTGEDRDGAEAPPDEPAG